VWSVSRLYNEEQLPFLVSLRQKVLGLDYKAVGRADSPEMVVRECGS
jgi:hypothetical protein